MYLPLYIVIHFAGIFIRELAVLPKLNTVAKLSGLYSFIIVCIFSSNKIKGNTLFAGPWFTSLHGFNISY